MSSDEEFSSLNTLLKILSVLAIPLCLTILAITLIDPKIHNRQYISYLAAIYIVSAIVNTIFNYSQSDPLYGTCSNNAVGLDYTDGTNNICSAVSFVNSYVLAGAVIAWLGYIVDTFYSIRCGPSQQSHQHKAVSTIMLVLIPFLWLILWAGFGLWG